MSMLSAQIDELRKMAEYYDGSEAASIMRYAADTIWQLRDNLQRTNTENTKLRELVGDMWFWGYEGHMESESQEWQMKHISRVLARIHELGVEV